MYLWRVELSTQSISVLRFGWEYAFDVQFGWWWSLFHHNHFRSRTLNQFNLDKKTKYLKRKGILFEIENVGSSFWKVLFWGMAWHFKLIGRRVTNTEMILIFIIGEISAVMWVIQLETGNGTWILQNAQRLVLHK